MAGALRGDDAAVHHAGEADGVVALEGESAPTTATGPRATYNVDEFLYFSDAFGLDLSHLK